MKGAWGGVGWKMAKQEEREMLDGVLERELSDQSKATVKCLWTNHAVISLKLLAKMAET